MPASTIVVGEFFSSKDKSEGYPFSSPMAKMFKAWMGQNGLDPRQCSFTNVINDVPPIGKGVGGFFTTEEYGVPDLKAFKSGNKVDYLKPQYFPHLEKLWAKINTLRPNLVLACGELACWALTSGTTTSMQASRGRVCEGSSAIPWIKVLPTYSPMQIVMDWSARPVLFFDFEKAGRESQFPEIVRPKRFIHIAESLQDLYSFEADYITKASRLGSDIETAGETITCIGLSTSAERAIVVPFYSDSTPDHNYWPTISEEISAWRWVAKQLNRGLPVEGQNYTYDMLYYYMKNGIKNSCATDDTMLMHHSMQPELRKGLGFLASLYTDELSWKGMHKLSSSDRTGKKGDEE